MRVFCTRAVRSATAAVGVLAPAAKSHGVAVNSLARWRGRPAPAVCAHAMGTLSAMQGFIVIGVIIGIGYLAARANVGGPTAQMVLQRFAFFVARRA